MKRIAVFASGSGSNAENFINYFRQNDAADISLVLSDNKSAKVLQRAEKHGVPHAVFTKEELACGKVLEKLKRNKIDFIVLAGFLRLVPANIINRIRAASSTYTPHFCPHTEEKVCMV